MCAIGRALMSGPNLLLLDEPSRDLHRWWSSLRADAEDPREGYTVLIVEQNVPPGAQGRRPGLPDGRRPDRASGSAAEMLTNDAVRTAYLGL